MGSGKGDTVMINLYCFRCGENIKVMKVDNPKTTYDDNFHIPVDFSCSCLRNEFNRGYEEGWADNERL